MTIDPRTTDEIESDLEDSLRGKIRKLTNFVETSFNKTLIDAYANEVHEADVRALAAQLSGWVRYAGNSDLDETDLNQLGVDGVEPEEINEFMESEHLDQLGQLVGVERDPGSKATGTVTITTASDSTEIPEGTSVTTEPDARGNTLKFLVDANGDGEISGNDTISPSSGNTTVQVDIIAEDVGNDYNVGSGTIANFSSPPVGVEAVTNSAATSGGEDEQNDEDLREDIQNAVFESSGGGTAAGIEGALKDNVTGVADVELDEFVDQQPPYVDVIVDGGSDSTVQEELDRVRPVGVKHNLVRPEKIQIGVYAELVGTDIDTQFVHDEIDEYLEDLQIGEDFRRSILSNRILRADNDIDYIGSLTPLLNFVADEEHTYQAGTDIYEVDFAPFGLVRSEHHVYISGTDEYDMIYNTQDTASAQIDAIVDGDETELTEGVDFQLTDTEGDSRAETVDFSVGGLDPDDGTTFTLSYDHTGSIGTTIEDENGNTYDFATDFSTTDDDGDGLIDSIDWSIGGSSPADGVKWYVSYGPQRTITGDLQVSKRKKITPSTNSDIDSLNI